MGINRLAIVGTGNVGSGLVMQVAREKVASHVTVASHKIERAHAAVLDAGSAYPETAAQFEISDELKGEFDVVVHTAGILPHGDITPAEMAQANSKLALDAMANTKCGILVVIGSPVDVVTQVLTRDGSIDCKQIIGFGGELDLARMKYALIKNDVSFDDKTTIIGEHGKNAIPVYAGEKNYESIRKETTSVLSRIMESPDKARNIATGIQLARLLEALGGNERTLCVSLSDNDFDGLGITWPYVINENGAVKKVEAAIGAKAQAALDELIQNRKLSA